MMWKQLERGDQVTDKRKLAEDLMVDIMYATAETLLRRLGMEQLSRKIFLMQSNFSRITESLWL